MPAPAHPKIYHIVHVDRLASIISDGFLWSDAEMSKRFGAGTTIGMSGIKQRRLLLPVRCHPGDHVGDYVPFYFCPRSIMLYVIYRGNHPDLSYRGGQEPLVHLGADLHGAVRWAGENARRWAFSLSNAGAFYAEFRSRLDQLDELNWPAIAATDFRTSVVREGKQAEFLTHTSFPWVLVERIGVASEAVARQVASVLRGETHQPRVDVMKDWYY